jgi:hypothetical protein
MLVTPPKSELHVIKKDIQNYHKSGERKRYKPYIFMSIVQGEAIFFRNTGTGKELHFKLNSLVFVYLQISLASHARSCLMILITWLEWRKLERNYACKREMSWRNLMRKPFHCLHPSCSFFSALVSSSHSGLNNFQVRVRETRLEACSCTKEPSRSNEVGAPHQLWRFLQKIKKIKNKKRRRKNPFLYSKRELEFTTGKGRAIDASKLQ